MQQIAIQVQDNQQVTQIKNMLADFDFVKSIDVDTLWYANGEERHSIKIIESAIGPMISESRVSVYDVMEAYDEGYGPSEIRNIYNLSFHQVEVALAYIKQHRATLEPKLKEILRKAVEREAHYRAIAAERDKQFPTEMTPKRQALQALVEESRRKRRAL